MDIGIPKEIKTREKRVSLTPACVRELREAGHAVVVETGAGLGSGFEDADYAEAGARLGTAADCWACGLVVKVKEPLPSEYAYFRKGLILFTYLHLAAVPELERAILASGMTAVAYETVQAVDGSLPLLAPMSEVAGRIAVVAAASLMLTHPQGRGMLLGGVAGVDKARVVVIGAGAAGQAAVQYAVGMGADVTVLDVDLAKLRRLEEAYGSRVRTLASSRGNLEAAIAKADLLVSTVLIPGKRAPRLVTEAMVKSLSPGAVIVDVAIDQGGSVETVDRATTHDDPVYVKHGVLHYAVANMPGAAPRTSTLALSNATLPYVRLLAAKGAAACEADLALGRGLVRAEG